MMQWMVVVLVLGSGPVKTELTYESLEQCREAASKAADEYLKVYGRDASVEFKLRCVPHAPRQGWSELDCRTD